MSRSEDVIKQLELFEDDLSEELSDQEQRELNTRVINRHSPSHSVSSEGRTTLYHSSANNSHFVKQGHFEKGTVFHLHPDDARKIKVNGKTVLSRRKVLKATVDLKDVQHGSHNFYAKHDGIKVDKE